MKRRLEAEGRWAGKIELERDQMMKLARKQGMSKTEAQAWVYSELDRMYPPLARRTMSASGEDKADNVRGTASSTETHKVSDDGQIQGLSKLPDEWPEIPSNAAMSTEIGWVQANRLRIVEERPGAATVVRLELALSPAPSWAALGWLETSIRSYAKFVDVAAKVSGAADDEGAVMRRVRMAIEEMRGLLEEMREDEG